MKPALFIGFGGTGALVLQKTKFAVAKYFHEYDKKGATKVTDADIPACFRFIEVDIDTGSAEHQGGDPSTVLPFDIVAGTELFVSALNSDFKKLESDICAGHAEVDRAVRAWWPEGLGNDLAQRYKVSPNGAFQIRQVGRLALWKNKKEFSVMLSSAINALKSNILITAVNKKYPDLTLNVSDGIDIFVATSGAGGTGCGMALDGLALISDAKDDKDTVNTFLLLPSTYKELVMDKEGETGYRATQVNSYALLKEFDGLQCGMHGEYTEDFRGSGRTEGDAVVGYGTPSTYTYLITDTLENGQLLGGRGTGAAAQAADFVVNLCLGLQNSLDKSAAGRKPKVTGPDQDFNVWPVATAYSAFGHACFAYPQDLLSDYARQHIIKRLVKIFVDRIGDARKKGEMLPVTEKDVDDSIDMVVQGAEQTPVWMGELLPSTKLNRIAFDAATVENYAAKKRHDIVRVILADHGKSAEDLKTNHERRMDKKATAPLLTVISDSIAGRVAEYLAKPWYGVSAAAKYLESLHDSAVNQLNGTDSATEITRKAHAEFPTDAQLAKSYEDIAAWRIFTAGREQRIRQLLCLLQADTKNIRSVCDGEFKSAMIQGVIAATKDLSARLNSLKSAAAIAGLNARTTEKHLSDDILIPTEKTGKYFGCSRRELDALEKPFKDAAVELLVALNERVCATGLEWPEAFVNEKADLYVKSLHTDKGFLARFKVHFESEIARTDSTQDILSFLVAKVKSASPMIPKPDVSSSPNYYLLAKFTEQDFKTACADKSGGGVQFTHMDSVDSNSIIAIAIRDGLSARKVKEVSELFKIYASNKTISRPDRFPKLSAHILKDAQEWNDIVPENEGGKGRALPQVSDPGRYIALALELGMLKKDAKGSWYRFDCNGEPKKVPIEENPNQWETKNMLLAFQKEDFIKEVRRAALACIHNLYADIMKYAAFRVKTPKLTVKSSKELGIDTTKRVVPEDMDKEILASRNWTEEQCARVLEAQANA